MKYTLYITDGCPGCDDAIAYLKKIRLSFRKVNIHTERIADQPQILVVPALYKGSTFLGYGPDIATLFPKTA